MNFCVSKWHLTLWNYVRSEELYLGRDQLENPQIAKSQVLWIWKFGDKLKI